jgi:hypothetical protein
MSSLNVRLPDSIHDGVRVYSKKDNSSMNQFIASAVTEKLTARLTEDYIENRAARGNRELFDRAMAQVPDVEPPDYDKR